jgi:hypothetical protein
MTTTLNKPLTRAVTIGDVRYKVVMTEHGVRLTQHGKRRGIEVSWSSLISLIDTDGKEVDTSQTTRGTGVPEAITQDVAREIRAAAAALTRADEAFRSAGILPPEVLTELASDAFHQRPRQEPDWFIEPLLTSKEVAAILRLPNASVRSLGMKSVRVAGELRYRQSVVRAYLIEHEEAQTSPRSIADEIISRRSVVAETRTHPQARRFKSFYNRD